MANNRFNFSPAIFLFFLIPLGVCGQSYPQVVTPGQTKSVTASAKDTLWILNNRQFDKANACKDQLKYSDSISAVLEKKNEILNKQILNKDSTLKDTHGLYKHYLDKWETCDKDLEKAEIKIQKQKRRIKIMTGLGILAGFLIGIII